MAISTKIGNFIHKIRRKIFFKETTVEEYNRINNIEYNQDSKAIGDNHLGGGKCFFQK
jgi:hypothetical protein